MGVTIEMLEARRLCASGIPDRIPWFVDSSLPVALGEVSAGVIGDKLYVVGEGDPATLVYDLANFSWSTAAPRPNPGNHHAAEVVNNRLYLFGGLTQGSEGEVQIFEPAAGTWSKGADMPFAAGSNSSALIGGKVFVAGGIIGSHTTDRVARYDPDADAWTELAPMPVGRNHAASGTDGQRLYVFGGRGPGSGDANVLANGFNTVQVYDPATNTWASSETPGATLAPLPQARGGMGKAAFLFDGFYVMGGETLDGPGAASDGVYDRVDVYNPATNTWRAGEPMPVAMHGTFPVVVGQSIFIAGGGIHAAGSQPRMLEVFSPDDPRPPAPPTPVPTVVGQWVFYNNSAFDGFDPAPNAADDAAVATDKSPLAGPATFANYTSYERGLNGVMVDVANLPAGAAPSAADFAFEVGNASPFLFPWTEAAPAPSSVTLRRGAGVNGSDRITLTWPDGAIVRTWLRVRVLPTANTGLSAENRFYFGNWPGETGNKPGNTRVNKADVRRTARNRTRRNDPPAQVTSAFDFNRDGVVNALDRRIAARNRTNRRSILAVIEPF